MIRLEALVAELNEVEMTSTINDDLNEETLALLARLEARCWADATNYDLVDRWRHAAARVSGNLSMKAELLSQRSG